MAMERVLLQTIKFDFNIEHAHKEWLTQYDSPHYDSLSWLIIMTHTKFIIQYCEELRGDVLGALDEDKVKGKNK